MSSIVERTNCGGPLTFQTCQQRGRHRNIDTSIFQRFRLLTNSNLLGGYYLEKRLQPGYPFPRNHYGTNLTFPSLPWAQSGEIKALREIDGRAKLVKPYGWLRV